VESDLVHGRAAGIARVAWFAGYLLLITLPVALAWVLARDPDAGPVGTSATDTGLLAFSLVVVSLVLMARVPSLVAAFGIEHVLLMHRLVAVAAVLLVLVHLGLVIDEDPRGWSILDVGDTSAPARAAIAATVAMLCAVLLALRRRRRGPR
jgi:predicted ferric reductase